MDDCAKWRGRCRSDARSDAVSVPPAAGVDYTRRMLNWGVEKVWAVDRPAALAAVDGWREESAASVDVRPRCGSRERANVDVTNSPGTATSSVRAVDRGGRGIGPL